MIPARVRHAVDWWRDMPGVEKYRLYTRLVLQSVMVAVVAMLLISGSRTWPTIGIIIAGLASIAGIEAQPDLAIRATGRQRRLAWRFAVAGVAGVWLVTVVGSRAIGAVDEREAAVTASMTLLMASAGVIPFVRHRWPVLIAGAILTPLLTRGPDG